MMLHPRPIAFLAFLSAVLALGGASAAGMAGNILLEIGATLLICLTLWRNQAGTNTATGLSQFLAAFALIAAIQFLLLPPILWHLLPGRDRIAHGFEIAGMAQPWLSMSLDPWNSLHSLVWWLPAVGLFIAARDNSAPSSRLIVWTICAFAYISVLLASVQALSGAAYFYTITNFGNGVGFFANSNHFGTLMLVAMALLAGEWLRHRPRMNHRQPVVSHDALLALLLIPLLLGIYLSASLACALLTVPLLGGIVLMARPRIRINWPIVGLVGLTVLIAMIWMLNTGMLSNDLLAKSGTPGISRGEFLANGLRILKDFQPFGSGLGTFPLIYPWYEQADKVGGTYVNHAHNDLVELLIETGIFGVVLCALFLIWLGKALYDAWSNAREEQTLAQGATLAIALTLAHSLVDYPLRTAAISGLIAVCCVLARRAPDTRSLPDNREGAGKRESMMDI